MPPRDKLTRWLDLIAALLRRRVAASFDDLRTDVPDYVATPTRALDSVARTFERDKDELRALGIAIETIGDDAGGESRYRLRADAFYLPYLSLCESTLPNGVALRPDTVPDGLGFKGLHVYPITPDERDILRRAAARARSLGNAVLEADADGAVRKLEFDLGLLPGTSQVLTRRAVDSAVFETLGAALERRKRVTLRYRSMGRDETAERTVEPYGLVFITGHWYLVANDPAVGSIRQFRVSRIASPVVNSSKPAQPDFEIPPSFDLQAHTASRQAWELGDGDAERVLVRFRGTSGQVQQALRFSTPPSPEDDLVLASEAAALDAVRVFSVRRTEPFLRWLLTFAGDARPLAPNTVVEAWRAIVHATLAAQDTLYTVPSDLPLETMGMSTGLGAQEIDA